MLAPTGSYDDLVKRMTRRMQQAEVDSQIIEILQPAFEKEFGEENVTLSRSDRIRLFQRVAQAVLAGVLEKIGGTN